MAIPNPRSGKEEVATRQGTKQRMNVRVLAASMVMIVIIFAGLYFIFLSSPHSENEGTAPANGAGQGAEPNRQKNEPSGSLASPPATPQQ